MIKIHNFYCPLILYYLVYSNYIQIVNFSFFFKIKSELFICNYFYFSVKYSCIICKKKLLEILVISQKNEIKYKIS